MSAYVVSKQTVVQAVEAITRDLATNPDKKVSIAESLNAMNVLAVSARYNEPSEPHTIFSVGDFPTTTHNDGYSIVRGLKALSSLMYNCAEFPVYKTVEFLAFSLLQEKVEKEAKAELGEMNFNRIFREVSDEVLKGLVPSAQTQKFKVCE